MTSIKIRGLTEEELKKLEAEKRSPRLDDAAIQKVVDQVASGDSDSFAQRILSRPPGSGFLCPEPALPEILRDSQSPPQPAPEKKTKMARNDQITKERCQTAAKLLWKDNPGLTIAEAARHSHVYNMEITGARSYDLRTVRDWVAEVFPKNQKKQIGRPRKKLK